MGSEVSICRQNHKLKHNQDAAKFAGDQKVSKISSYKLFFASEKINHKNKVVKIKLCLLSLLPPSFPPPNCNTSMPRGILAHPVASPVGNGQRMTQLAWNKSRSDLRNDPYFPNAMVPARSRFWIGDGGYFSEFVWSLLHAQSSTSFRVSARYLEILIKHKCSPMSCTTQWPGIQNKSFLAYFTDS